MPSVRCVRAIFSSSYKVLNFSKTNTAGRVPIYIRLFFYLFSGQDLALVLCESPEGEIVPVVTVGNHTVAIENTRNLLLRPPTVFLLGLEEIGRSLIKRVSIYFMVFCRE